MVGTNGKVVTTDIVEELVELSKKNIKKLKLKNVELIKHDGSRGYAKEAPYDKIIITAACPKIPKLLIRQLREKGIIVAPVGNMNEQTMVKGRKVNSKLFEENLGRFMFVPLKGKYGYTHSHN